jgi:hypothetical protein
VMLVAFGGVLAAWAAKPPVLIAASPGPKLVSARPLAAPAAQRPVAAVVAPRPAVSAEAPAPVPAPAQPAPAAMPALVSPAPEVAPQPPRNFGGWLRSLSPDRAQRREATAKRWEWAAPRQQATPPQARFANTMASVVHPGSAVKLDAKAEMPQGGRIVSSLTAFGSQDAYRSGYYLSTADDYILWTRVAQLDEGDVHVSVVLTHHQRPVGLGEIVLAAGKTAQMTLSNGQTVVVTPTIRPETAQEVERGQRTSRRAEGPRG